MPNEPIDPNQNKPMQPVGTPPAKPSFNGPLKPGEQETYIERIKKITQRIKKRVKKPTSSLAETEEPNEEIEEQDQEEPQEPEEKQEQQKEPEERPEGEKIKDEIKPENETPEQPSAKQPETPKGKMPKSGTTPSVGATPPATGAAGAGETVAAGTGGVSGATAGAGAAASAEVAGAGAAASAGAGATAAAPILPYILIGLAIILGVAAIIILIVLIFSVLKGAGRSTPQYPDYTKAEDAGAAGTVLAASQTQDASLIAKAAGTETQEASKKIESDDNSQQATKYFWEIAEAKAQNNDLTESAQKQINKLETNASVLANSVPSQKSYVKEKILENKKILSTLTNPSNPTDINEAKKQVDKVVTSYEKVLSSDKTILQINPFDVEMIKTGQVDKRIILALKKIVDFSLSQTGENAERYSLFRVGKIYKADPYDKRETPLEEEEEFVSAHHFGQAIDINIVGKLKCTQNYWYKKKTSWHPCYVYYQGGGPQAMQVQENKNYAALTVPLALLSATESLGPLDINNTRNFYELFQSLGSQTIREEMGIDENYWDENTPFTPEKILASYLAQKTNLPISAISALIKTGDTKSLDRGIIEEQLKLPSGSLQGSNWNEIFTNTYKSYLSQTLGLQGIEINDFNSSQELGQALIKKSFYTQTDENQIFSTVTRSNVFYQNLWQLNPGEMTLALQKKDLNYLASLIGNKFKDGFMNQENPQYQTNWLGLPKGNLSDPKYKIAAGRYILAMIFNLEDQEKAFTSNDYFFKNAPYSPSVGFDICPGIAGEQTCPTYEIFNDPNNFFQKVGEALIVKKDTDLDFGSDFGSIFKKSLGINKISLTNLAKILSNGSEKEKLNQAISVLIQETLKDNLEISNQLPGIFSENRIKNGDWAFILNLLGLNKVSREAVLPPNTLEKLSLPNIDVEDVAQEIASYQILESLGVNPWSLDKSTFPDDWYKNPQELITIAIVAWLNNRGIEIGNLDLNGKLEINLTDFNSLMGIAAGDTEQGTVPENIAALLGLSTEELKMILDNLKNNKNSDTVRQLLSETADQKLGLPPNSTYQLLKGGLNINDWLESAWMENTLFALADQKAAQALNLPEESKIDLNQLINSIRSKDGNELENFLINVAQAKLGDIFKIPPTIILNFFNSDGDYQSQINDLKTLAIEKFAQNIVNNESQYNLLISAYENYLAGGSGDINNLFGDDVNINELISSSLNIPNNDASYFTQNNLSIAFSVLGAAKIANQAQSILGEQGISYEEVKKSFLGDLTIAKPTGREAISIYQTEQEKIKQTALKETAFNLADAALFSQDPDIPVGITKIMTEGTTDQKNRLLVDYIANKAGINPIIINDLVLKQDFDLQNLDVENFILGLPGIQKNTQQFNQIYNAFLDLKNFAKTENFESFSDATTSFLEEKTGIPINTLEQWQVALNNPSQLSNQLFIADQIGLTDAIDNAVGMNGFSGFVVNASRCYGSGGSDLGACASAVLQVFSWLGFGKVSCEDPQVVAQKQIRTTLTQVLDTDPTPTKIITFKKEDVYYFAGLNENGEFSQELNDLLTQKYGPIDERGDKGMFTSPTMWDHVHIGY